MINYKVQKVLKIIVKVFSVPYNHQQRQLKKKKVKVLQQRLKRRETKIKSLKSNLINIIVSNTILNL